MSWGLPRSERALSPDVFQGILQTVGWDLTKGPVLMSVQSCSYKVLSAPGNVLKTLHEVIHVILTTAL